MSRLRLLLVACRVFERELEVLRAFRFPIHP